MLPSQYDYLHAKNLGYELIPFRDNNDQRILQSDRLGTFWGIAEGPDFSQTFPESFHRIIHHDTS